MGSRVVLRATRYAKQRGVSKSGMVEAYLAAIAEPAPRLRQFRQALIPESQAPPLAPQQRIDLLGKSAEGPLLLEVGALSPLEFVLHEFVICDNPVHNRLWRVSSAASQRKTQCRANLLHARYAQIV